MSAHEHTNPDEKTIRMESITKGGWAEVSKDEVREEWSERGLGGKGETDARETMVRELRSVSRRLTIDLLERHAPSPTSSPVRLLELGCGWGRVMIGIKQTRPQWDYQGIDLTPNLIELARRHIKEYELAAPVSVQIGDAENPAFDDGTFDFIYSCRVFQYLPNPETAAKSAFRLLRPGGRAVIILPNRCNPKRRKYHTRLPWPREIRGWLEGAGFQNLRTEFYGFMPGVRSEPLDWMDRTFEAAARVPLLRRLGALVAVSGDRPGGA